MYGYGVHFCKCELVTFTHVSFNPQIDMPNSVHAFQTAERIREVYPDKGNTKKHSSTCFHTHTYNHFHDAPPFCRVVSGYRPDP